MYKLILITNGEVHSPMKFESELVRSAYAAGFLHGTGQYGGDEAQAYKWPEEAEWMKEMHPEEYEFVVKTYS